MEPHPRSPLQGLERTAALALGIALAIVIREHDIEAEGKALGRARPRVDRRPR